MPGVFKWTITRRGPVIANVQSLKKSDLKIMNEGQNIGHYTIISQLGRGGMGEVYLAEDTKLDRQVAIKVLPDAVRQDPERLARFRREAKAAASLNHPSIATIHAVTPPFLIGSYDVSRDGRRFVMVQQVEPGTPGTPVITLVQDWYSEFKDRE